MLSLSVCVLLQEVILLILILILILNIPLRPSYRQNNGNGQLLSRRYCKHSGWLFSRASRTALIRPTALWRFRVSTSNSRSGRSLAAIRTHASAILIILTLNKIFEYVEMTILQPQKRQSENPKVALTSSRKYLSTSR